MSLSLYFDRFPCTVSAVASAESPTKTTELVLLHGWGMHGLVWDEVMPELLTRFNVTVIDMPGFGRSPMPGGEYNLEYLVEHVLACAPEKAVWVGWSLGGLVAIQIAASFPERVSGLITVAASPRFTANERWPVAMKPELLQGFYDILLEDWEGTLIRFLALQCKDSATLRSDIRQLRELVYFHGLPAQKALRCGLEILAHTDLLDALANIRCPTLHIYGEKDNLIPVGVSKAILEFQPEAQVAILKGVSHVPFVSVPDLFVQALNDFAVANELIAGVCVE